MAYIWGVDLGGTKIEAIIIDTNTNETIARKRIDTEAQNGYQHIISRIKLLIEMLKEETKILPIKIGFSTPGTLDPGTQTMKNSNTVCMNGMHMKLDIENSLNIEAVLANDANCFALAEATMGAAKDLKPDVMFGVIMGTGVGGGVVVNGKVIGGKHGIGGEWGHNVIEPNGTPCYCGKSGCNETVFSGPSLQLYYEKISGKVKNMKEIYADREHDAYAAQTIERMLDSFALAISAIINVLDPEVIVLGGGLSNLEILYTEGVKRVEKYIFNNKKVETVFLKPALGDSAGVFGAAELVR